MSITGTSPVLNAAENLLLQVDRYLKFKTKHRRQVQVAFFGGNFLGLRKNTIRRLLDESAALVTKGAIQSIRFSTRPDTINDEALDLIAAYPVSTIEIGVQSMDDEVLTLSQRGHTAADTKNAVDLLKSRKYHIGLQMMIGLPGEDETKALFTAQRVLELAPAFTRIYPTVVLANSPLADWYKSGRYAPWSLDRCVAMVKKVYLLFQANKIPVIRMGLQASEELAKESTVVAGPYHPAFGHLVHPSIFFDKAMAALAAKKNLPARVSIKVHPNSIPKMRGLNNANIAQLKSKLQINRLQIIPDPTLTQDELTVV
jgi:histone acetyltransferase (RNA polymerase elongator complex component)